MRLPLVFICLFVAACGAKPPAPPADRAVQRTASCADVVPPTAEQATQHEEMFGCPPCPCGCVNGQIVCASCPPCGGDGRSALAQDAELREAEMREAEMREAEIQRATADRVALMVSYYWVPRWCGGMVPPSKYVDGEFRGGVALEVAVASNDNGTWTFDETTLVATESGSVVELPNSPSYGIRQPGMPWQLAVKTPEELRLKEHDTALCGWEKCARPPCKPAP